MNPTWRKVFSNFVYLNNVVIVFLSHDIPYFAIRAAIICLRRIFVKKTSRQVDARFRRGSYNIGLDRTSLLTRRRDHSVLKVNSSGERYGSAVMCDVCIEESTSLAVMILCWRRSDIKRHEILKDALWHEPKSVTKTSKWYCIGNRWLPKRHYWPMHFGFLWDSVVITTTDDDVYWCITGLGNMWRKQWKLKILGVSVLTFAQFWIQFILPKIMVTSALKNVIQDEGSLSKTFFVDLFDTQTKTA